MGIYATQKNFAFFKLPPQETAKKKVKNSDFFCHAKKIETLIRFEIDFLTTFPFT